MKQRSAATTHLGWVVAMWIGLAGASSAQPSAPEKRAEKATLTLDSPRDDRWVTRDVSDGSLIFAGYVPSRGPRGRRADRAFMTRLTADGAEVWHRDAPSLLGDLDSIDVRHLLASAVRAIAVDATGRDVLALVEVQVGWLDGGCAEGVATAIGTVVLRLDAAGRPRADAYLGPLPAGPPPFGAVEDVCAFESASAFAGRHLSLEADGTIGVTGRRWSGKDDKLAIFRLDEDLHLATAHEIPTPPGRDGHRRAPSKLAIGCPSDPGNVVSVDPIPGGGVLVGGEPAIDLEDDCMLGVMTEGSPDFYGFEVELLVVPPPPSEGMLVDFKLHHNGPVNQHVQVRVELQLLDQQTGEFETVGAEWVDKDTHIARGPIDVANPADYISSDSTIVARLVASIIVEAPHDSGLLPNCEGGDWDFIDQK